MPHFQELLEKGYTKFEGVFTRAKAEELRSALVEIQRSKPKNTGANVPYLNQGHEMLYNLQNQDAKFFKFFLEHPPLKKILKDALNDPWYRQIPADQCNFILRSLIARSGGPEPLPLHIDSFVPSSGKFVWAMQLGLVLEDQHPENGCTVVVPGSHLLDRYADQASLAKAVPLVSKAGDVVVWDSRLWHGTTGNHSGKSRWAIIATFVRWWIKQNYDITRNLPDAIYQQLTDEERAVMGYCSIPPLNEYQRIDIKAGFDELKSKPADFFKAR